MFRERAAKLAHPAHALIQFGELGAQQIAHLLTLGPPPVVNSAAISFNEKPNSWACLIKRTRATVSSGKRRKPPVVRGAGGSNFFRS
jgi:hypothetical protein